MNQGSHVRRQTKRSYPTMSVEEMHARLEQLKGQLAEAQLAPDHYSSAAQQLLSDIEELRRFWAFRRTLIRLLAEPSVAGGAPLGVELGNCLFRWVPGIKAAQISGDVLTQKVPDTQTRRLHATVLFLMNLDFRFGVPCDNPCTCKAA